MKLLDLKPLQIAFIIAAPIAIILLVIFFIVIPINKRKRKKHFKDYCYKAIYRIAFDEDYYLINNFLFRVDSTKIARIDHILFGNKYIYVLNDIHFDGDLIGKENDKSFILIDSRNSKFYTDNQFNISKTLTHYLASVTGIDESMFVGIVIVNNECHIGIESTNKQHYIIQRNKLKKLVRAIESRDVANINAAQLESAVKAIDKLNRTKRGKK